MNFTERFTPTPTISSIIFRRILVKGKAARRGISVVEAVIAMALISILSAAAFTAINASLKANTRSIMRFSSISLISDSLECFKYSRDTEEFKSSLVFSGNDFTGPLNLINSDYMYVFDKGGYKVIVTLNWEQKTFAAYAQTNSGEVFYTFNPLPDGSSGRYKKGG